MTKSKLSTARAWAFAFACVVFLSSCEFKGSSAGEAAAASGLSCSQPQASGMYGDELGQEFDRVTQERIAGNYADLVDPAKTHEAYTLTRLTFSPKGPDPEASAPTDSRVDCVADVSASIDQVAYDSAQLYAPFIYAPSMYGAEIDKVASANRVDRSFNVVTQQVHYSVIKSDSGETNVSFAPGEFNRMAETLMAILIPYGVKDQVNIDGALVDRKDALAKVMVQVQDEKGAAADSQDDFALPGEPDQAIAKETEAVMEAASLEFSRNELKRRLNATWKQLDPAIRETLRDEQDEWVLTYMDSCVKESKNEKGDSDNKALMSCEVEKLKGRISYLQGFKI